MAFLCPATSIDPPCLGKLGTATHCGVRDARRAPQLDRCRCPGHAYGALTTFTQPRRDHGGRRGTRTPHRVPDTGRPQQVPRAHCARRRAHARQPRHLRNRAKRVTNERRGIHIGCPLFALTQEASCANGATAGQRSVHAAVTYSNGARSTHALDEPNPTMTRTSAQAHTSNTPETGTSTEKLPSCKPASDSSPEVNDD